jgi:hypothetical protein
MFMAELSHESHELTRITFRHGKSLIWLDAPLPPKPGFSENRYPVICAGGLRWHERQASMRAPMAFINGNRECPAHSWPLSRRMECRATQFEFPGQPNFNEKISFQKKQSLLFCPFAGLGLAQRTRLVTGSSDLQVACYPF